MFCRQKAGLTIRKNNMNLIEALILGLIQGITEFIPVSSSGHLTLFGRVFGVNSDIMMSFTTLLHVGTLIAVFIVMRKEIMEIIRDIFGKMTWLIVVATIPAVVAALLLGDWFESLFDGRTLGYQFLMTGVILLSIIMVKSERSETRIRKLAISDQEADATDKTEDEEIKPETNNSNEKEISYKQALIAGLGQAVAIMPGISRSGSTLAALLHCKIKRKKAIRFSFLMSIPAIAGGFALDLVKLFKGEGSAITEIDPLVLIIGVAASAISGYLAMNYMLKKLTAKGILVFASYVIVLGLLVLIDQNWVNLVF